MICHWKKDNFPDRYRCHLYEHGKCDRKCRDPGDCSIGGHLFRGQSFFPTFSEICKQSHAISCYFEKTPARTKGI